MFTWICPTCGRECPPSYTECPDCSAKQKAAPAAPVPVAAPPVPVAAPPPPMPPVAQHVSAAPPPPLSPEAITGPADLYRPPPPPNLPAWAVTVGVALLLLLLGGGLYYFIGAQREDSTAAPIAFETPGAPAGSSHPYAKHLELAGFRITEDARRRPQIRYLIINHSSAELASVPMRVTFTTSNAHPDAAPVATVNVKTPLLGAYESEEMVSTINTNLRAYELPDWQFLRATFEVTGE